MATRENPRGEANSKNLSQGYLLAVSGYGSLAALLASRH